MTGRKTETLKEGYSTYYSKDKATLSLFYGRYPYKKRTCDTCLPYVPLEEDTDEQHSLTYQDWQDIIQCYFKYVCLYLISGKVYRFGSHMGEFQIQKYKSNKKNLAVDMKKMLEYYMEKEGIEDYNEAKKYVKNHVDNPILPKHKNKHTMGYKWIVVWFKKGYSFAFKHHWKFRLSKRVAWKFIDNMFKEDRTLIHGIVESHYSLKNKK